MDTAAIERSLQLLEGLKARIEVSSPEEIAIMVCSTQSNWLTESMRLFAERSAEIENWRRTNLKKSIEIRRLQVLAVLEIATIIVEKNR